MISVNLTGSHLAPLSMAQLRASVYGTDRGDAIDFFAGMGGMTAAFTLAGGRVRHAANHWTKSTYAHGENFGDIEHTLGDLSVMDPKRLPVGFARHLVCAPECFPAGTLVLTARGLVEIEDVAVGDRVLTHKGRWRPVTDIVSQTAPETVVIAGEGLRGLETTPAHPFFARQRSDVWNNARRGYDRVLGPAEWTSAADMEGRYWCAPTRFGKAFAVPPVPGRGMELTPAFWWMVGRWLGDGCLRMRVTTPRLQAPDPPRDRPWPAKCVRCPNPAPRNPRHPHLACAYCTRSCRAAGQLERAGVTGRGSEVQITCGLHESDGLLERLMFAPPRGREAAGIEMRWHRRDLRTGTVFTSSHDGLARWLREHFGEHAHGKTIPAWALTMPAEQRRALLDGYVSADGHDNGRMVTVSTVSRRLAVGVRLLALSLNLKAGLSSERPGKTSGVIEGRRIKQRRRHFVTWTTSPHPAHERAVHDSDGQWRQVRTVSSGRRNVEVFNITVQEDESYVVDGVVVHNCRRHSPASNWSQAVMELAPYDPKRETERSRSTMWCPQRWSSVHRFESVICENVVEVCTKWNQFGAWVREWDKLGYNLQVVSLNSAFFFAPQSRDRVALVATLKGLPIPNLDFRPSCWCWECEENVYGIQTWKKAALRNAGPLGPVGKYGWKNGQYLYACPACKQWASPHIVPAITALDPTIEAPMLCDREKPLKPKTLDRMIGGMMRLGQASQLLVTDGREGKKTRPAWLPAMVQTGRQEIAVCNPPTIVALRRHTNATDSSRGPAPGLCAGGQHHAVVGPDQRGAVPHDSSIDVVGTVTAAGNTFIAAVPISGEPSRPDVMIGGGRENNVPRDATGAPSPTATAAHSGGGLFMVGGMRDRNVARDSESESGPTVTANCGGGGVYVLGGNRTNNNARNPRKDPSATVTSAEGGGLFAAGIPDELIIDVGGHTYERRGAGSIRARSVANPAPTQDTSAHRAVVGAPPRADGDLAVPEDAYLAAYNGSGDNMRRVTDPSGAQTGNDRYALLVPAGGTRQTQAPDASVNPAPTRMLRDTFATVQTPTGPIWLGACTFRMLTPKEAQALMDAQWLPNGNAWRLLELNGRGSSLTITNSDAVRLAGNAVCQTTFANVIHRVLSTGESDRLAQFAVADDA
jgi:site-specific DNA-cytosine methylase